MNVWVHCVKGVKTEMMAERCMDEKYVLCRPSVRTCQGDKELNNVKYTKIYKSCNRIDRSLKY